MTDDPAKPPRFPCAAALLCAACLGAATWTWMRYSYGWSVRPHDLPRELRFQWDSSETPGSLSGWRARYLRVQGVPDPDTPVYIDGLKHGPIWYTVVRSGDKSAAIIVISQAREGPHDAASREVLPNAPSKSESSFTGRLVMESPLPSGSVGMLVLDERCSRFHGASIAGIVVGAMGVFIFGLYLRAWLRERRTEGPIPDGPGG